MNMTKLETLSPHAQGRNNNLVGLGRAVGAGRAGSWDQFEFWLISRLDRGFGKTSTRQLHQHTPATQQTRYVRARAVIGPMTTTKSCCWAFSAPFPEGGPVITPRNAHRIRCRRRLSYHASVCFSRLFFFQDSAMTTAGIARAPKSSHI